MFWFDKLFRPNLIQQKALERLGIDNAEKLLRYFPNRYDQPGTIIENIADLTSSTSLIGKTVTIYGQVLSAKTKKGWRRKIPMGEALIGDETGKIKVIWFHQPYLAKKISTGSFAAFRGKIAGKTNELYLTNPEIIERENLPEKSSSIFYHHDNSKIDQQNQSGQLETENLPIPVYPETKGINSGWFYYQIKKLISTGEHKKIIDPIPEEILKKYNLPSLSTALVWIHLPKRDKDATTARKRFAFEEVFFIQLARLRDKKTYQNNPSFQIKTDNRDLKKFINRFSFKPTDAQTKAINQILEDFNKDKPMIRLLEGDVGSGKTMVAAASAWAIVKAGCQVSYMAPTEILARQHFESFAEYFAHLNIPIGLITGRECKKFPSKINPHDSTHITKRQLLKWVANGEIPILVGTHALIQKQVQFKNLAYAIIDEQHRFGVEQRARLIRRSQITKPSSSDSPKSVKVPLPHLLSMTATPIPRTLALTIYGDLDLTLLDQMPVGRKPIITKIISPDKRNEAYQHIETEIKNGRQAYIICPRIDEPDPDKELALQTKSAKAEAKRLKEKVFPDLEIEVMHSKLRLKEKEETMKQFVGGQIDILVSTSVIEVGVNVPNATIIVIEGAERFGLAQLHQLRGRVLRSNHQAYCYIFSDTKNAKSMARLKALIQARNGFELAEQDLALRGAGTMTGEKQWGLSDLGMEAIKNIKLVEAARNEAQAILETDPDLTEHPQFLNRLSKKKKEMHFE